MNIIDLLLIAVSLSMDAFSVAICKGLSVKALKWKHLLIVGAYFGIFQAVMPALGYLLGAGFAQTIEAWDHWIAFVLLGGLGAQMIWEACKEESCPVGDFSMRSMVPLAIATSIDALVVGVTFAFLKVNLWVSVGSIGLCTFFLSALGVGIGHFVGQKWQRGAQILGGVALMLIGLKILLEHLGIWG